MSSCFGSTYRVSLSPEKCLKIKQAIKKAEEKAKEKTESEKELQR